MWPLTLKSRKKIAPKFRYWAKSEMKVAPIGAPDFSQSPCSIVSGPNVLFSTLVFDLIKAFDNLNNNALDNEYGHVTCIVN